MLDHPGERANVVVKNFAVTDANHVAAFQFAKYLCDGYSCCANHVGYFLMGPLDVNFDAAFFHDRAGLRKLDEQLGDTRSHISDNKFSNRRMSLAQSITKQVNDLDGKVWIFLNELLEIVS